ncbi:MAG: S1C family serine protease [Planctomycetota bacterium]
MKPLRWSVVVLLSVLGCAPSLASGQDASASSTADLVEAATPFVLKLFATDGEREFGSAGTGFVVRGPRPVVVTNFHVVQNAERVYVLQEKAFAFELVPLLADPGHDLAIFGIPTEQNHLRHGGLRLAAGEARVGEDVLAIGFPRELGLTVTRGVVSGVRRFEDFPAGYSRYRGMLDEASTWYQIDAALNSGNSGGPLLNRSGEVVGVNTMSIRESQGLHFALKSGHVADAIARSPAEEQDMSIFRVTGVTTARTPPPIDLPDPDDSYVAPPVPELELDQRLAPRLLARQMIRTTSGLLCTSCDGAGSLTERGYRAHPAGGSYLHSETSVCRACDGDGMKDAAVVQRQLEAAVEVYSRIDRSHADFERRADAFCTRALASANEHGSSLADAVLSTEAPGRVPERSEPFLVVGRVQSIDPVAGVVLLRGLVLPIAVTDALVLEARVGDLAVAGGVGVDTWEFARGIDAHVITGGFVLGVGEGR